MNTKIILKFSAIPIRKKKWTQNYKVDCTLVICNAVRYNYWYQNIARHTHCGWLSTKDRMFNNCANHTRRKKNPSFQ